MPSADKKPYHHGDLREALLEAAELVLARMPVEEVSLREIARTAGVSHAAPKHHFATLGQLLGEIAARGFERFVAELEAAAARAPDQSPARRMQAMGRAYLRFAATNPAIYGLMFGKRENVVDMTPHLSTAMFAAWAQLEQQAAALAGPQKAAYAAVTVWSMVHGLAMLRLEHKLPPHIDPEIALETVTRTLVAGLEADT